MNKKYILWDNDGVLVETEPWYFEANRIALAELGISISQDEYMNYMQTGESLWMLASQRGFSEPQITAQRQKRDDLYQDFLTTRDIEIPGVENVLKELQTLFSMAIVTTSKKEDFELIHKNRRILQYMEFYLTIGDYPQAKPAPDPYLAAMMWFGAAAGECVVIEDSARGLRSALAAGIDCIIVKNEFTKSHDFSGALTIADSIKEIQQILL